MSFLVGEEGPEHVVVDALHKFVHANTPPSTFSNASPLPILEPVPFWERPVTPLHFLLIIGGCAAAGFAIGIGLAALLANHWGKKAMDALGLVSA